MNDFSRHLGVCGRVCARVLSRRYCSVLADIFQGPTRLGAFVGASARVLVSIYLLPASGVGKLALGTRMLESHVLRWADEGRLSATNDYEIKESCLLYSLPLWIIAIAVVAIAWRSWLWFNDHP